MYKTFNALLTIFWIFDVANLEFMEMFDITYPINGWVWLCIWLLMPSTVERLEKSTED